MSQPRPGLQRIPISRTESDPVHAWENEGGRLCLSPAIWQAGFESCSLSVDPEFTLLDAVPLGILTTNGDGEIVYSNPASHEMYAASASEMRGVHWLQTIDPRDRAAIPNQWKESNPPGRPLTFEARIVTGSGKRLWTRHSVARLEVDSARGVHIHTIEDISRAKAAEKVGKAAMEDLFRERERARVTLECIGDAVISTDARGCVTYLNTVAEQLTGWSRDEAIGQLLARVFRVVDADRGRPILDPADRAMKMLEIVKMPENSLLLRPDGTELAIEDSAAPILDKGGCLTGAVVIFRDRRLSRENVARMAFLARHDTLTGLVNRLAFAERFDQAIKLAQRHAKRVGLLFIDLDNFKHVNDTFGHGVGDGLLRKVSSSLVECIRTADTVCRYGGDEFAVLLSEINSPEDAGNVALKMQGAVSGACQIQGHLLSLEISIGISLYPDDGSDLEVLIGRADTAMYHAKLDAREDPPPLQFRP